MIGKGKRLGFLPGWRIFTYVVIATNLLMLSWLIASVTSADKHKGCGPLETVTCINGRNAGPGIAAMLVITVWALLSMILGALWLNTKRDQTHLCPECGHAVRSGTFRCRHCTLAFRVRVRQHSAYSGHGHHSSRT